MNHVILIGRLATDPELRFIPNSGRAVVNFTLAVDRNYSKEKKSEMQEKCQPTADFIRCIAWGKTAETIANYLFKGKQIAINGSIQTGSYKTETGETRYTTDVLINHFEFVGGKTEQSENKQNNYTQNDFETIDDSEIPF